MSTTESVDGEDMSTFPTKSRDEDFLDGLNKQLTREYIPVIVFVVVHMIVGISGNALACIFYGFITKRTCNSVFIASLAVIDLCVCISSTTSIADIIINVYFDNTSMCMLGYFCTHPTVTASLLMLVVITLDRYFKICRPFARQFNIKRTKQALVIVIVSSVLFAARDFLLIDTVKVQLTNSNGTLTTVHYCSHTDRPSLETAVLASYILDAAVVCVVILGFCVCYSMILCRLIQHKRHIGADNIDVVDNKRASGSASCSPPASGHAIKYSIAFIQNEHTLNDAEVSETTHTSKDTAAHKVISNLNNTRLHLINSAERNITYTMLLITLGFVVSFIPHFISLVRIRAKANESDFTYGPQLMYRMYMLNSVINPFVYCFFNIQFRKFLYKTCCSCIQN